MDRNTSLQLLIAREELVCENWKSCKLI